ncbi:hypothetical protein [Cupriavidus sp. BIC8F]|uniref:hypothetical protein n=1 Tax=Cupriavidus sp. BIC8F TaxID=3079014 RepID=UPI002915CC99|nr:hypothetical protein [Cupriavidus sp. BIC8F]
MTGRFLMAASAALSIGCTGCASIVGGNMQTLSVDARQDAQMVLGATCTLTNDKGKWFVTTPGSVGVQRSYDAMNVNCTKTGSEPGLNTVQSTTKPMAFGNIIFGGLIGAAIDVGSGAAYEYPNVITVEMKKLTQLVPNGQQQAQSNQSATATPVAYKIPRINTEPRPGMMSGIALAMANSDSCRPVGTAVVIGSGEYGDIYQVDCVSKDFRQYACIGSNCRKVE